MRLAIAMVAAVLGCGPTSVSRFVELGLADGAKSAVIAVSTPEEVRYIALPLDGPREPIIAELTDEETVHIVARAFVVPLDEIPIPVGPIEPGVGHRIPESLFADQMRTMSEEQDSGWIKGETSDAFAHFTSPVLPHRACREFRTDRVIDLEPNSLIRGVAPLDGGRLAVLQFLALNVIHEDNRVEPLSALFPSLTSTTAIAMKQDELGDLWLLDAPPSCAVSRLSQSGAFDRVARFVGEPGERCEDLTLLEAGSEATLVLTTDRGLHRLLLNGATARWEALPPVHVPRPFGLWPIGRDRLLSIGKRGGETAGLYEGAGMTTEPLTFPYEIPEYYDRGNPVSTSIGLVLAYNSFLQVDFVTRGPTGKWTLLPAVVTNPLYAFHRYGAGFVAAGEFGTMLQFDPLHGYCEPQGGAVPFCPGGTFRSGPDALGFYGALDEQIAIVRGYERP